MTLLLRYAARSDRGLVRANNEDSVYAGARLLALADGMGGHAAGEVASQLVVAALAHLDDDEPGGDLLSKLNDAVREGNSAIAAHVEVEPELDGMGTTLTAILFAGNRLGLVHIGDSRGYLLRDGELTQITKDDTFVQTLVDEGRITAEEAHSHPQRSLIMRALTGHEVEPTLIMREARVGDRYMLCSDGLSDPVSQDTILEALKIPDVAKSADRLIELALRGGGPDNVTVVVADVVDDYAHGQTQPILAGAVSGDDGQDAPPNTAAGRASAIAPRRGVVKPVAPVAEPPPPPKRSRKRVILVAALLVLVLIAGLVGTYLYIFSNYYVRDDNGTVTIMRGVPGELPGFSLQKPYRYACVNDRDTLSIIDVGSPERDCKKLAVSHLKEDARKSLQDNGLPTGSYDEAMKQLEDLVKGSLLPPCVKRQATTPSPTTTPAPAPPVQNPVPGQAPEQNTPGPGSNTSEEPGVPSSSTVTTTATAPSPTVAEQPADPQDSSDECRPAS